MPRTLTKDMIERDTIPHRLDVRWIQHTGIFTPVNRVRFTSTWTDRRGKRQKARISVSPGRVYIPNREKATYSCYPDLFAAIRSRGHITEKYGFRKEIGEIPELEAIIKTVVEVLARMDFDLRLEPDEKKKIQQSLVEAAANLAKVRNELKKKAAIRIARGLLDSLNRVNPLIARGQLGQARELLEARLQEVGIIVPFTVRQRAALIFEARRMRRLMKSAQESIKVANRFIDRPNLDVRLETIAKDLDDVDLRPMKFKRIWAKIFIRQAIQRIKSGQFFKASTNLARALRYLDWTYPDPNEL